MTPRPSGGPSGRPCAYIASCPVWTSKSARVDFQADGVGMQVPAALRALFCHLGLGTVARVGDRRSQLPGVCHVG